MSFEQSLESIRRRPLKRGALRISATYTRTVAVAASSAPPEHVHAEVPQFANDAVQTRLTSRDMRNESWGS